MQSPDFEKLYNACYMRVYAYALSLCKDPPLAEELTQHAFFKAMLSSFKSTSEEFTWLCAIVKNLWYDELRRRKKRGELSESLTDGGQGVEEHLVEQETILRIHLILRELEEPYAQVFALRVFGALSYKEISALFGKTESWARVTYHRARIKILQRLEE